MRRRDGRGDAQPLVDRAEREAAAGEHGVDAGPARANAGGPVAAGALHPPDRLLKAAEDLGAAGVRGRFQHAPSLAEFT